MADNEVVMAVPVGGGLGSFLTFLTLVMFKELDSQGDTHSTKVLPLPVVTHRL